MIDGKPALTGKWAARLLRYAKWYSKVHRKDPLTALRMARADVEKEMAVAAADKATGTSNLFGKETE